MKYKLIHAFIIVISVTFSTMYLGCQDYLGENELHQGENELVGDVRLTSHISKEEAISISLKVLNDPNTRTYSLEHPNIDYVLINNGTRGELTTDTLAYIINYVENPGFVIVSSDRRIFPVLAFSKEGSFSFDNENAKLNFIDRLQTYMDINLSSDSTINYVVKDEQFDQCYVVDPIVNVSLDQRAPWNKYVLEEHPFCPVGCVAVATALVMSHSKEKMAYHNSTFYLKPIITAIQKGNSSNSSNVSRRIVGGLLPTYSYQQAVDSMAKLLYWIGKDVDMNYTPSASGAYSIDAYNLCKSLGFNIPSQYAEYNIEDIANYLNNGHIVYLRGTDVNNRGGHAWVSDGCYYCVDPNDRTQIVDAFIHCDWGWGGSCNGYYSGAVFAAAGYQFEVYNYFAVKREWK